MASSWYDEGIQQMTSGGGTTWASDDVRVLLVKSTYTFDATHQYVTDITPATYECDVTSYARKQLASKTKTYDAANTRVKFDAADPVWSALESGNTLGGAIVFKQVTNDTDSPCIAFLDDASDLVTNGGQVTLQFAANGCATITVS